MKNQPATAILGAALNAYGYHELHDYMRVHQPKLFRDYARRYVAAALPSGKRYVAGDLVKLWGSWPALVKDDFRQRHRAEKPKDVEFYVQYASDEFIDQFPATLHGYKPGYGQYWYEPQYGKHKDRPTFTVKVETGLMGPRFMEGAEIELQRVTRKREIQPGRVYGYWNGWNWDVFRVVGIKGRTVFTSYDGITEDGTPGTYARCIGNLFDKARRGHKVLAQFVDYGVSGNPAKWALMQELSKEVDRQVAARKERERQEHEQAQQTAQQLAEARRRIAELEGTTTPAVPQTALVPRRPNTGRAPQQRVAA